MFLKKYLMEFFADWLIDMLDAFRQVKLDSGWSYCLDFFTVWLHFSLRSAFGIPKYLLFAIWLVVIKLPRQSKYEFYTRTAVPPEQRVASSFSQHDDEGGCTLSLCCKFEINLRLFAIWLVMIKFLRRSKYEIFAPGLPCYLSKE